MKTPTNKAKKNQRPFSWTIYPSPELRTAVEDWMAENKQKNANQALLSALNDRFVYGEKLDMPKKQKLEAELADLRKFKTRVEGLFRAQGIEV